jgi:hypothetical protein
MMVGRSGGSSRWRLEEEEEEEKKVAEIRALAAEQLSSAGLEIAKNVALSPH